MSVSIEKSSANGSKAWPPGTVIGVSLSLLLFAALVWTMFWLTAFSRPELLADGKTPEQRLRELQAQDRMTLSNYGWVDRPNGIVRIPIDRAMLLVVEDWNYEEQAKLSPTPLKVSQP